jgi:CheY-like chemotaxis protein
MPSVDTGRVRVAIVEDDREMRGLLREALGHEGYAVTAVGSGAAASEAVRGGDVDAVILDVWLPDADGVELCRAWRRSGLRIPILMLTARTDVAARVAGLEAGADDYLGKPFAMAELRARLNALLRRGTRPLRGEIFRRGPVSVDFGRRQAWVGGQEVAITRPRAGGPGAPGGSGRARGLARRPAPGRVGRGHTRDRGQPGGHGGAPAAEARAARAAAPSCARCAATATPS